jgi:MFS family permease
VSDSARGRYRDALRQHDFRLLALAYLVNEVGSWSYSVVIAVDVFDRTHSGFWLAILAASRWIVGFLLSSYAGVIADRYERTRVMLVSTLASGLVMSVMAVAVGLTAPIWVLVGLTILVALVSLPYPPAASALTPVVVDESDLAAANGLLATLESLVQVVGPAIGGLLLLTGSAVTGVVLNAASFFVAAVIVLRLRVRSHGVVDPDEGMIAQWTAGFRTLGSHHVALTLVIFCALDSMVYGASVVVYAPLSERLGTGANGYSYLLAGHALGGVIAAALANRLSARPRLAPIIGVSMLLLAVPFAVSAYIHSPAAAFVLQMVSGVGMVIVDVLAITALQRDLDDAVMGRVLGAFDAIVIAAILLASFLAALILAHGGLNVVLLVTGIGIPVVALIGMPLLVRGDRVTAAAVALLEPRVELLGSLDLLTGASRTVLERLAKAAEEREISAGTLLIRQGEVADALWVLVTGRLAVSASQPSGEVSAFPDVSAPSYVGEIGLVRGVLRTATVEAAVDSSLLRIDGGVFLAALESAPPSMSFVQLTGTRWSRTEAGSTGSTNYA